MPAHYLAKSILYVSPILGLPLSLLLLWLFLGLNKGALACDDERDKSAEFTALTHFLMSDFEWSMLLEQRLLL